MEEKDFRKTIKEKQIYIRNDAEKIKEQYDIRNTNFDRDEENHDF